MFGLLLREFPLYAFGLDKLSCVIRGEVADFFALGAE